MRRAKRSRATNRGFDRKGAQQTSTTIWPSISLDKLAARRHAGPGSRLGDAYSVRGEGNVSLRGVCYSRKGDTSSTTPYAVRVRNGRTTTDLSGRCQSTSASSLSLSVASPFTSLAKRALSHRQNSRVGSS